MTVKKAKRETQATAKGNLDNPLSSNHPKIYKALGQQKAREQGDNGTEIPQTLKHRDLPLSSGGQFPVY